ncbi:DUF3987 domain-containing protein [Tautonia marina]|uniref:DUF3987 domain-containing protein n=1 Tax=Tautonia marina TaxID=2653855 RepID=UPI001375931F|nr:DUF3987 domain-containing protein [Tautonia marina]
MSSPITPAAAWIIGRLVAGLEVNGHLDALDGPLRGFVDHLAGLTVDPADDRKKALDGFLAARDDRDEVLQKILAVDLSKPIPEAEQEQEKPDEGDDWGPIRFGTLPSVEPFPLHVLSAPARDLAEAAAESIGCPVDFPAVACLAVASGIIGQSVRLLIKAGYFASASVYAALVGGPSIGKSPALRVATLILWAIANELHLEWQREMEAWEMEDPKERGPKPQLRRLASSDCTTEALGPILADNPRGLTVLPDEMTKWVLSMDQYKGGKGGDRPFYLSAWAGEPVFIDRAKNMKEPIAVPHPFLTVIGGMTPDMLSTLPEGKGRDDGFLARLLFAFPDPVTRRRYSERGIPEDVATDWANLVRSLWGRGMRFVNGREQAHVVGMTPEARKAWVALMNAHLAEHEADDFDDALEGCWGKLEAYAGRLALILHLMDLSSDPTRPAPVEPPDLGETVIDAAADLLVYFKSHARRTYAAMGGKAEQGGSDVRAIIRWVLRNDLTRFSTRDIDRNIPRFHDNDAALTDVLDWLVRHNIIRPYSLPEGEQPRRGRKRVPEFDVNPLLRTSPRFRHLRR